MAAKKGGANRSKKPRVPKLFQWTAQRELVAALLAADELTDAEIAAKSGVAESTINLWKLRPEFAARVQENVKKCANQALGFAICSLKRRLRSQDDRWRKLHQIATERGADAKMADVPGGKTGLLVHQVKGVGKGDDFELVNEYILDAALLREMRDLEKHAAQEAGQWAEKLEVTGKGGGPIETSNEHAVLPIDPAALIQFRSDLAAAGLSGVPADDSAESVDQERGNQTP